MRAEGAQGATRSSRLWVGHGAAGAAGIGVGGSVAMAGKKLEPCRNQESSLAWPQGWYGDEEEAC